MIEGSSIDKVIIDQVKDEADGHEKILFCLDSNHIHGHVLAELEAYASLVSCGSSLHAMSSDDHWVGASSISDKELWKCEFECEFDLCPNDR